MFCRVDAIPPFFRPPGEMVNDSSSVRVAKTIQSIFKTLKQDVRLIREHAATKHHLMIEALPFPTLRKDLAQSGYAVDDEVKELLPWLA